MDRPALKVQSPDQLVGIDVVANDGRRVGRVVAVACEPDPYTLAWVAIRLRGLRRRIRLVRATGASWRKPDALLLPYPSQAITQAFSTGAGHWPATGEAARDGDHAQ